METMKVPNATNLPDSVGVLMHLESRYQTLESRADPYADLQVKNVLHTEKCTYDMFAVAYLTIVCGQECLGARMRRLKQRDEAVSRGLCKRIPKALNQKNMNF